MKKTVTINLNNIVFNIDDDAYDMLRSYLADVEKYLSDDEKKEVMADIEARIAEIFSDSLKRNKTVINIDDVDEIINVLGKPNQYADDEENAETQTPPQASQAQSTGDKRHGRRFYRDPENAVLGGVASGLSAYLGWDVTWIRVGLILIVLIGWGTIIPIYLVAWLIAPKAVTVAQRLEMQGEDVTVENIKSEINNVKNYVESEKFKSSATSVGDRFLDIIRTLIKIVGGLIGGVLGFVGIIVAFALLIALLSLLFVPSILMGLSPELAAEWTMFTGENAALLVVSLLLVVGAPIYMIVYWAINLIGRKRYEHAKTTSLVVGILWIAGLFMLYSVGAKTIKNWTTNSESFDFTIDENEPSVEQTRTIVAFTNLDISDNIEVELTQDSTRSLVISAPERILGRVRTEVVNGTLKIYTDKFMLNHPVKVTLSTDSIFNIEASGAAQVSTTAPFYSSRLFVDLSGASHGNLDFVVKGMSQFKLSGASNINVNGSTAQLEVDASGASNYDGAEFISQSARAEASGASKIDIHATQKIQADASGTSSIDCTGNPATVTRNENAAANINIQ